MSDRKTSAGPESDEDVSPMEAQNAGPARKGPATGPSPQKKAGEVDRQAELERHRIAKGGEASRDDL